MAAQTPRDLAAEEVTREFTGWAEAQGYGDDELYSFAEMDETFAAGMEAARTLAAPELAALRGLVREMLSTFCGAAPDGYRARVDVHVMRNWRERGLEPS